LTLEILEPNIAAVVSKLFYWKELFMKQFPLSVSMLVAICVFPGFSVAQNEMNLALFSQQVAKSGCCKVRQSTASPWVRNGMSYDQCESINAGEGDRIYQPSGLYWWDRSC
jgi:hypothetical protein